MNRTLASIGIAAAIICGSAAPALAADNPIDAKITYISSGSAQVSSPVTVKGAWSTKKLEDAKPENSTWGWVNPDGTTSWMITWVSEPGVKYSIHDAYTKLSTSVKCAKGDTWNPNTTVYISAIPVNDYTIEFTAPEGVKVCVTYTPEPMATPAGAKTATNVAYVNDTKLERTIKVEVRGGTTGDGTIPTPAPNPTTTTPVPVHSPSIETPDAPQSGVNTPSAKPSPSETPIPSTRPTKTAEATKPSETKLAKTGTFAGVLAVLIPLIAAFGSIFYFVSRKEND